MLTSKMIPVHITRIFRHLHNTLRSVCDSLIALVILYRKHYPRYPLLLWLHSTEGAEHVFGLLRQLKKDFSYIDLLYFEAKVRALMRGAFDGLTVDEQFT